MEKVKIVRNVCTADIKRCESYEKGLCKNKKKCCLQGIRLELKK